MGHTFITMRTMDLGSKRRSAAYDWAMAVIVSMARPTVCPSPWVYGVSYVAFSPVAS